MLIKIAILTYKTLSSLSPEHTVHEVRLWYLWPQFQPRANAANSCFLASTWQAFPLRDFKSYFQWYNAVLPDRGEVFCGSNGYCKSRFGVMVTKLQGQLQSEIKKKKKKRGENSRSSFVQEAEKKNLFTLTPHKIRFWNNRWNISKQTLTYCKCLEVKC